MIIIERISRTEVATWEEAREMLGTLGVLLPDYTATNTEAGRPFTAPLWGGHYVTVRYEPNALHDTSEGQHA